MDTGNIKKFATEARNILKRGIEVKLTTLGFDAMGNVADVNMPRLVQGGCVWNGFIHPEGFYHQWMALYRRVREKSVKEVCEEAAYTWFNRLMAIRILQKNRLCEPVMEYADEARTPRIVDEARMGRIPQMDEEDRARLMVLLDDDTKTTEQFALLVTAFCHQNKILSACFGGMQKYTELLLPNNVLADGNFVDMINHTGFISDEDFRSPELIGWLYQFYISERKDEVFAKKGKVESDEIPAATQIFTPNWIVKYMVQNTVGRIYLDNNPWEEDELGAKWQYLVSNEGQKDEGCIYRYDELTQLKFADLSCGSGHILNEMFDILYELYVREGYSRADAIANIFQHNLTGIDIDTRAKQLATFALLLKACQRDASFADAHCLPRVLDMAGVKPDLTEQELRDACLRFMGGYEDVAGEMLEQDFELLRDADNLGSIMLFNDDADYLDMLRYHYDDWTADGADECPDDLKPLLPGIRVILTLTTKYSAIVMNPPYMGNGKMNKVLSDYVKKNYEEGKVDLCTVFMVMQRERTAENGYYANIIPPSWMFLSSFENLRKNIIELNSISSLLHLSRGVFGSDFGSVSCVIRNTQDKEAKGTYFRLIERTFQEFDQKHLQMLFEKTLANHDFRYFFADYTKEVGDIVYSEKGAKIYYPNVSQQIFEKIPGCPIGYWVSERIPELFDTYPRIGDIAEVKKGSSYCPKEKYVRNWFEIQFGKIRIGESTIDYDSKWYPCTAGERRKWYGNITDVVNYEHNGSDVKKEVASRIFNESFILREGTSWQKVSSAGICGRYYPKGFLFGDPGPMIFSKNKDEICFFTALLCSKIVGILKPLLNPTICFVSGNVSSLPVIMMNCTSIVEQNISLSKQDWDAHETSWDFERNELVATGCSLLSDAMERYKEKWEANFNQLQQNEEELNRQFIDIYGLQDDLTPDVPLNEITILQQGEISIEDAEPDSSI